MRHFKILALIAGMLLFVAPAMADEYKFTKSAGEERFAIALPNDWHFTSNTGLEVFFSKTADDSFGAGVGLISAATPLTDGRVIHHIDLGDSPTVTNDGMLQQAGFPARRIDGTAISEGDKLNFSSIAIKPTANAPIFQLTIWGSPNLWQRPDIKNGVESMLASFKLVQ